MFRRFLPDWLAARRTRPIVTRKPRLLNLEWLEDREVPSVTLASIAAQEIPDDRPFYFPVTVTNTPAGAVNVGVTSDNSNVSASVLTGGRSVRFTVSGVDANNQPFTGSFTVRLFENSAPVATQRIIDLANSGFYTNQKFHRIADLLGEPATQDPTNVIIQGGTQDASGKSTLPDFADEFDPNVTFASNGLVAMANSGDDTNNAQFFITDLDRPLAQRIEYLNFQHPIVGIITSGQDVVTKMRNTPRTGSTPNTAITINSATVFTDTADAVVKLTSTAGFTGTANINVTATDSGDASSGTANTSFAATSKLDTVNSRAFLTNPPATLTTTAGTPVQFTIPATDIDGDSLTFAIKDATFAAAPSNVTVSINQATHVATLTPAAGFTGTVQLKVGVRDQTDRSGTGTLDNAGNFDTQALALTVNPAPPVQPITVEGAPAGAEPRITVKNSDGSVKYTVLAFDASFTGGVRAVTADVTGDGNPDVVVTPGFGGAPIVKVLSGTDGSVLFTKMVFEDTFRGGLYLEAADGAGLGYSQVLVGAGDSGGPRVTLLDVKQNRVLQNFFVGDSTLRGGVSVDLAQVAPAGKDMSIIAGGGPGSGPVVTLIDAKTGRTQGSFFAGAPDDRQGILVKAGDVNASTGYRQIIVTAAPLGEGVQGSVYDPSQFIDPSKF